MDKAEAQAELRELQRGRGCQAEDMHLRLGPVLKRVCGVADADEPAVKRSKVVDELSSLSARLPPDLQLAVRTALALDASDARRFLKDRTEWLAQQFDRDPRTARRRVLEGFSRLAGQLTEQYGRLPDSDFAPDGWYVVSLSALLRMDLDPPALTEVRTIAAVMDDLDEIVVSLSVPREHDAAPGRVRAEVQYGGEIVEEHDTDLGHARFVMRLPRPLSLGEQHEYSISFRAVRRSDLRPYYVVSPLRRCDRFVVRVRFAAGAGPDLIWRVNGLPSRLVDDFQPTGELLEPDALGEVRTEFFALRQGLSYGLQWSAAQGPAGAIHQEGENDVDV